MKWIIKNCQLIIIAFLLYATPAFADCLLLPIIGDGHDVPGKDESALDDLHGAFRPKIPATLIAANPKLASTWTTGAFPPVVKGLPTRSSVYTCFPDSLKIPVILKPITRDDTARLITGIDSKIPFKPDVLNVPTPKTTIQNVIDGVQSFLWRWLGPAIAWATTATDDFNRADNADIGANWDAYDNPSSTPCQIVSNAVVNSTIGVDCVEGYNAAVTSGTAMYAQIVLPSGLPNDGFQFVSAIVRLQAPTTYSGYVCRAQPQPTAFANPSRIRRADAGSMSTLATEAAGASWSAADVLRCEANGSSINMKRNGSSIVTTSDSNYASGRGGINSLDDPASIHNPIDDFEVGDLTAPAVARHRPILIQ